MVWIWGSARNFLICSTELFSSRAVSSEAGASPPSSKSSGTSFRMCFCSTEVSATVWTADTSIVPEFSSVPPPSDILLRASTTTRCCVKVNKEKRMTVTSWLQLLPAGHRLTDCRCQNVATDAICFICAKDYGICRSLNGEFTELWSSKTTIPIMQLN